MRKESKLPHDWFEKARKDLQRVKVLLAADDIEGAGFHSPSSTSINPLQQSLASSA
jgi:hypothetical protein